MTATGLFIVFEGVDGGGKSTQIRKLSDFFEGKGYMVELHVEPTHDTIGQVLWDYMNSDSRSFEPETEALLFAADRIEHGKAIKKALDDGKVVISDRYKHSSFAYQGAAGVDVEWMQSLNKHAFLPNLVILLDIDPEQSLDRVSDRAKTVFEENEYLKKVREEYLRYAESGELVVVDALQSIETVHEIILTHVEKIV